MYDKKGFLPAAILLFLLIFSLAGCGKKQEVDSDIWSENKGEEEQTMQQPDTGEREITEIGEIPKNEKDIKKLLEDLEKDADKVDIDVNEEDFEIDDSDIDDSDISEEDIEEDINDSDIDAL